MKAKVESWAAAATNKQANNASTQTAWKARGVEIQLFFCLFIVKLQM